MNYEQTLNQLISQDAITGVDVSNCQGPIDFCYVEEKYPHINFAIIKMRDELYNGVDSQFNNNWSSISKTKIKQMVYSVISPNKDVSQVMPTIQMVDKFDIKPSCIMLDIETPAIQDVNKTADMINSAISQIQCQTNIPVLIYSYYPYIKLLLNKINHNSFAIANYSTLYNTYSDLSKKHIKLAQFSGWVPNNGCKNIMCTQSSHNHGTYLQLQPNGKLIAVDQDIFLDVEYYNSLSSKR